MTDVDDFFDEPVPDGPPRDRYGRPMLFPRGETERQPYTRASSLSDYLDDFYNVWKWKFRYLARELGQTRSRDLAAMAGAESYHTGLDALDPSEKSASGRRLDDIIERALDRAHISEKADYGTVVHAVTEPGNDSDVSWYHDTEIDQSSYVGLLEELHLPIIGTEIFTANDRLRVAGTFDNLHYFPGYGICVGDKKTSSEVHGESFRIQLTTYADGEIYDWTNDTRMTFEEYLEKKGWDPTLFNRDVGFIFWIKKGKTAVYRLDLKKGREAADHAVWVRDNHRKGTHKWRSESVLREHLAEEQQRLLGLIHAAPSVQVLKELWEPLHNQAIWNKEHTAAAVARKAVLSD
jgi:hypothetical protein